MESDTSHLFHDSMYGDPCIKLDVKELLEVKEKNQYEERALQYKSAILNRAKFVMQRSRDRERVQLRNTLSDIQARTPYLDTFMECQKSRRSEVSLTEEKTSNAPVMRRVKGRSRQTETDCEGLSLLQSREESSEMLPKALSRRRRRRGSKERSETSDLQVPKETIGSHSTPDKQNEQWNKVKQPEVTQFMQRQIGQHCDSPVMRKKKSKRKKHSKLEGDGLKLHCEYELGISRDVPFQNRDKNRVKQGYSRKEGNPSHMDAPVVRRKNRNQDSATDVDRTLFHFAKEDSKRYKSQSLPSLVDRNAKLAGERPPRVLRHRFTDTSLTVINIHEGQGVLTRGHCSQPGLARLPVYTTETVTGRQLTAPELMAAPHPPSMNPLHIKASTRNNIRRAQRLSKSLEDIYRRREENSKCEESSGDFLNSRGNLPKNTCILPMLS